MTMSPGYFSRNRFCVGRYDAQGRLYLTERVPFAYRELTDTRTHTSSDTDTLDSLAASYFAPLARTNGLLGPDELWWIIADFQPPEEPDEDVSAPPEWCIDPTRPIGPGVLVYIPSVRTVLERVFDESRRAEHEV
jgi:hypothetical protein